MAWVDKVLYWAGTAEDVGRPPTEKRLSYCSLSYPSGAKMKICNGVYENEVLTPLHVNEIQWHIKHGAVVDDLWNSTSNRKERF